MEMRAVEDVSIGEDLTPPLPPIAFVLRDSAVGTHCSACFSSLTAAPEKAPPTTRYQYCSPRCSSLDSKIHSSAAENHLFSLFRRSHSPSWPDSADLRLVLRLLSTISDVNPISRVLNQIGALERRISTKNHQNHGDFERIGGLMTNREKLLLESNDSSIIDRISEGVNFIATARAIQDQNLENPQFFPSYEAILCLVLTNAVEVHDGVGIAVYGTNFSWINHSCSPNTSFRFLIGFESFGHHNQVPLRISSSGNTACFDYDSKSVFSGFMNWYGPRIVVRSVQDITKGDEVTVAYTDLLQPKDMRREELWLKYRFVCSCKRCVAVPKGYVDYALEALVPSSSMKPRPRNVYTMETLKGKFDDIVADYLYSGNPSEFSKNLENLLIHGYLIDDSVQPKTSRESNLMKLHPFHHISLNAYISLASAYKVLANDALEALDSESRSGKLEAINLRKTSSAFSLLSAGALHCLFAHEPCLTATAANFFVDTGESLLSLGTSSLWDVPAGMDFSSIFTYNCEICSLGDTPEDHDTTSGERRHRVYRCIAEIAPVIWHKLAKESIFLESIPNQVDFSCDSALETHLSREKECSDAGFRMKLVLLSIHCLWYSSLLLSICNGTSVSGTYESLLNRIFESAAL